MGSAARSLRFLAATVCIAMASSASHSRGDQVVLGAEDDAAPWSYADGSGYVNDLVKAAFQEVGWDAQWKVMPYTRCKALAIAGKLAGCFSASKLPELESAVLYSSEPVFAAQNVLIVPSNSTRLGCEVAAWGDQTLIGLVRGYEYTEKVNALPHDAKVRIDYADSEVSNLRKLQAGRIDAAVVTVDEVKRLEYLARLANTTIDFKTVCDLGTMPAYVMFSRLHVQGAAARAAFDEGHARLIKRRAVAVLQLTWRGRALDTLAAKPH
ncbi:MAG: hypothetical protein CFE40_01215 [Burkholderiales bacterium PBB1]|nr:MAG: hypothetical protein CFE40_01215 [Burkholderiales bacterium PBB1]